MDRLVRVALVGVLVAGVLAMGVYYDGAEDRYYPYPDEDRLAADYDSHVGERALLWGTVQSVDEEADTARIEVEHSGGTFEMTVQGFDVTVEEGGGVQVLGVLRPDRTIAADNVEIVNPSGNSTLFKYAVSGIGALLVVAVFLRYWRIDLESLTLEAR